MIKKLISAALSAVLVTQCMSASAAYYTERELREIDCDELVYETAGMSVLKGAEKELERLVYFPGHEEDILKLFKDCSDEYEGVSTEYTLARLQSDIEYNEKNRAALSEATDALLEAAKLFNGIIELIYLSDYDYVLKNLTGAEELDEYVASIPSERFYELSRKEQELVNSYNGVCNDPDAAAQLYIELAGLRNEIAAECGYDNYAEYADNEIYPRDYTTYDIMMFSESVINELVPLMSKLLHPLQLLRGEAVEISEKEALDRIGTGVGRISGELRESYDYMLKNRLYNVGYSEKKAPASGGYTVDITKLKVPFLFLSPENDYETDGGAAMHSIIHEFGHYSAMLNDPKWTQEWDVWQSMLSVDTCELQSQGLELMMLKEYGRLFGKGSAFDRYFQIYTTIATLIDGCFLDEWQRMVFADKELTVEKCNDYAAELIMKYYGMEWDAKDVQKMWTAVPHNFCSPMYYISYSVSAAAALELMAVAYADYDRAADIYMRISSLGGDVLFKEAMRKCSLNSIFNESTIRTIVQGVEASTALNYFDVDYDGWYMPYLYTVSDIFEGRCAGLFMPDKDITRGEFITLIGRMYDSYNGIDESCEMPFTDIDASEESAEYVAWAYANNIVNGYDDSVFGFNDTITREQLAVILYRLASLENSESTGWRSNLSEFNDTDAVSGWAVNAMGWAVDAHIINGRENGMLAPKGAATRAEAAKLAACYIELQY